MGDENTPMGPFTTDQDSGPADSRPAVGGDPAAGTPAASSGAAAADSAAAAATPAHEVAPDRPSPAIAPHEGWGNKVMSAVLQGLGGKETTEYSRTPDGKLVVTHAAKTPGQQWRTIIASALTGASAAAAVPPGPGHASQGGAAGFKAVANQQKQDDDTKRERADQDYDMEQRATVRKAQTALLNQQLTESSFHLGRMNVEAQFEDQTRENEFMRSIQAGGSGTRDLGVIERPADGDYWHGLLDLHKGDPSLIQEQAKGNVIGVPHISANGKIDGMHYAVVTPEWKNSKIDQDEQFYKLTPPTKPGAKPSITPYTVKAGTMTNGDFWTQRMGAENEILNWYKEQSEEAVRRSTITKNYAEAGKAAAETEVAHQTSKILSGSEVGKAAQMLVDGQEDPSQLSKRAKEYQPTINAANEYSLKTYGIPWNAAQASIDYKFAANPQTQNTLKYLNSLTGSDNKGGNLGVLVGLSDKISRTQFPAINDVQAWARINTGDPKMAAYHGAVIEVADQLAKILQGGGSGGGTSDAKLKQAAEIFDKKFTKQQIAEIATTLRPLLANRKKELIGDNRYLRRQFMQPPVNATHEVVVNNQVVGHMVMGPNGEQYVPLAGNQPTQ